MPCPQTARGRAPARLPLLLALAAAAGCLCALGELPQAQAQLLALSRADARKVHGGGYINDLDQDGDHKVTHEEIMDRVRRVIHVGNLRERVVTDKTATDEQREAAVENFAIVDGMQGQAPADGVITWPELVDYYFSSSGEDNKLLMAVERLKYERLDPKAQGLDQAGFLSFEESKWPDIEEANLRLQIGWEAAGAIEKADLDKSGHLDELELKEVEGELKQYTHPGRFEF